MWYWRADVRFLVHLDETGWVWVLKEEGGRRGEDERKKITCV